LSGNGRVRDREVLDRQAAGRFGDKGGIVMDKKGTEKENLTVDEILSLFNSISIECGN